jgi:hypothetical protein
MLDGEGAGIFAVSVIIYATTADGIWRFADVRSSIFAVTTGVLFFGAPIA